MITVAKKKGGKSSALTVESEEEAAATADNDEEGKAEKRSCEEKTKKRKKKKSRSDLSRGDVARLVMSLSCHGYEEQLAWLEAYLRDEAQDRRVDGQFETLLSHSLSLSHTPHNTTQHTHTHAQLCIMHTPLSYVHTVCTF